MAEQMEMFEGNEISEASQQKREQELLTDLSKIGKQVFDRPTTDGYSNISHDLIKFNKKLIEYFDNTRLLKNQPKDIIPL